METDNYQPADTNILFSVEDIARYQQGQLRKTWLYDSESRLVERCRGLATLVGDPDLEF